MAVLLAMSLLAAACGSDGQDDVAQPGSPERSSRLDDFELTSHQEAIADEDTIWFTMMTADAMTIERSGDADRYLLTLSGVDDDIVQFSDIPDPHHELAEAEVDRTVHREPVDDVFERWSLLEDASHDAFMLHAPNTGFTYHRPDGTRASVVFALHELVEYRPQGRVVVFEAASLAGEDIEEGEFVDVSTIIDGWVDVTVWCSLEVVTGLALVVAAAATAGTALILGGAALTGVTYNCVKALASLSPRIQIP